MTYWLRIGLFLLIFFVGSCTTEKNTLITRSYHNVTSHYNIYFNGNESFKKGMERIEESWIDDYSQVLPVFKYGNENIASSIGGNMEGAQKKALKVIQLHSITVKPEYKKGSLNAKQKAFLKKNEYNNWVDDNYLLIGKAHFFKNDFGSALETFRFMLREFPEEEIKYEAMLWIAKCYIQTGDLKSADEMLNTLKSERKKPKRLNAQLNATYAHYYIVQENYKDAIPYLKKSLSKTFKRQTKIRYTYILAQLYLQTGKNTKSYELFKKVIKMNPPYEMTFNAQINMAESFESGSTSSKSIKELLAKMLKDEKNKEYQDQIYYALAEIAFKEGKEEEAIKYYSLSAENSIENTNQKARSYLALADIFYAHPNYIKAQAYYDSAVVFLEDDYPNYEVIYAKSKNLNDLVANLRQVKLQDSVLVLAAMPESERMAVIENLIKEVEQKEAEQRRREQERMEQMRFNRMMTGSNSQSNTNQAGGKWYFYNIAAKSFGQTEFKTKWGNRKLEDDWRRKNKSKINSTELIDETGEAENKKAGISNKSPEYYLQDIPLSDSAKTASHEMIKESLINIGLIYKNNLRDYDKSIESFEDIVKRYPNSDIALSAYYNMYIIYNSTGNKTMADKYKNLLISKFPDSNYAKALTNPDYFKEIEKEERKAQDYYEKTLVAYNNENYQQVLRNVSYALATFDNPELISKYRFLEAVCIGKTSDALSFRNALSKVIEDFPKDEVAVESQKILTFLDNYKPEVKKEAEAKEAVILYSESTEGEHFIVFGINNNEADVNQLTFNILNFNLDNYDKLNLTTSVNELSTGLSLIAVESFRKYNAAMDYYKKISVFNEIFKDVLSPNKDIFVISQENLNILKETGNVSQYVQFFNQHFK